MAATADNESVSLSLSMEVNDLEDDDEISTMATLFWSESVWMGRWTREQQQAWSTQIFEDQRWKAAENVFGPCECVGGTSCWHREQQQGIKSLFRHFLSWR